MKRVRHIDIAKGLGIILVVWGHTIIEFGHYVIYMFHMPLFFYLSGIFHKPGNFRNHVLKKFNGLIVPLFIFMMVLSPLSLMIKHNSLTITPPHLRYEFGPLWFLWALFVISILYHLMLRFKPAHRMTITIAISLVFGFIPSILHLTNWLYSYTIFSMLTFYCAGNIFCDKIVPFTGKKQQSIVTVVLTMMLLTIYLVEYKILHQGITDVFSNTLPQNFILFIFSAIVGIAMIISLSKFIDGDFFMVKIIAFIGECSLYIFALHMALIIVAHHYITYRGIELELLLVVATISLGCLVRPMFKRVAPKYFK